MGRHALYDPDIHPQKAKEFMEKGATKEGLAAAFGIATGTIYEWINKYPELAEAVKEGTNIADEAIVGALYKSAYGFIGPDGKYYPPNQTAQVFWLKNRKTMQFRDKREIDAEVNVNDLSRDDKLERILSYLKDEPDDDTDKE